MAVATLAALLLAAAPSPHRWFVDARALASDADGSAARPFRRVGRALEKAADGDEIVLRTGLYEEQLILERQLTLSGPPSAVISAPEGTDALVTVAGEVVLSGLSVRGGEVGVVVRGGARLESVSFSGQRQVGLRAERGHTEIRGGQISASFAKGIGIEALPSAELDVRGLSIDGPFRFGIRARGAQLSVEEAQIEGPQVSIACVEGCRGSVRGSSLFATAHGRGAGLVVGGARLAAQDNLISHFEQCVAINAGSSVVLHDNVTAFCSLDGIASVASELSARNHIHVGPSLNAGIQIIGGRATVDEGVLLAPGTFGIAIRNGQVEIRGTCIRGAQADREGDLGDGVYAHRPESLTVAGALLESNAGSGLTQLGGTARAVGVEVVGSRGPGVVTVQEAKLELSGVSVARSGGPGVLALNGSQIRLRDGRLQGNRDGAAAARCDQGAAILAGASRRLDEACLEVSRTPERPNAGAAP